MPAVLNIQCTVGGNLRTAIIVVKRNLSKRCKWIKSGKSLCGFLDTLNLTCNRRPNGTEGFIFKCYTPILCTEYLALKVLELLCYVSLTVCKGLLSDICFGNEVLVGICNLNEISKHLVIWHLELWNTGCFLFSVFNLGKDWCAVVHNIVERIYFLIIARLYHSALANGKRRLVHNSVIDKLINILQGINAVVNWP